MPAPRPSYGFPKTQRLHSAGLIQQLFKEGKTAFLYPFQYRFICKTDPDAHPPLILISVSKKRFRRAVDRNWIKRRIRESYRLNKSLLQSPEGNFHLHYLAIIYVAKEKMEFHDLDKKLKAGLKRLNK